eukprot:6136974-Pleurochrysis_carterae.AAC.1
MGYLDLNQEQVAAMPCNLVRILRVGVRRVSRVKFQERGSSGRGTMPMCGLDDKCCNDAVQAGLAQGR